MVSVTADCKDAEHQRTGGCRAGGKAAPDEELQPAFFSATVEKEGDCEQQQHQNDGNDHAGLDGYRLPRPRPPPPDTRIRPHGRNGSPRNWCKIDRRRHAAENGCDQRGQRRKPGQPVHGQPDEEQPLTVGFPMGKKNTSVSAVRLLRAIHL